MLHSERKNYQKKISKLNKDFPPGFKTIDFRMLPDMIKYEIILLNKYKILNEF